jgi:mitochondrial chaperone BCS1
LHLKDLLHTLLSSNQFAQGGILLMALGGALAYLRSVPLWCWYKLKDQVTISITITDDVDAYKWLRRWFSQRPNTKRIRRVDIHTTNQGETLITPAPGGHWTWYRGRPVHFEFMRSSESQTNVYNQKRKESVTFRTIGRNQQFVRDFMKEVEAAWKQVYSAKPSLYVWSDGMWQEKEPYEPRELDSVLLPNGHKDLLLGDIQGFKDAKGWYAHMGIPYHRGYLFYGLPGTGKTSLVTGLSSHFNSKVYILKLSELNDRSLVEAITQVEAHSMVIMEDADCVQVVRNREEEKDNDKKSVADLLGVTLSGLLNTIDGLLTPSGVMFFMTTNHINKLDPALIRPGRIDLKLEFGLATIEQKSELYNRFFPNEAFPLELRDTLMTMADLQGRLMLIRNERMLKGELKVAPKKVVPKEAKITETTPATKTTRYGWSRSNPITALNED